VFAFLMAWGSVGRLVQPVEISFDQAIFVAVLGLLVNGVSALILGGDDHGHDHDHDHDHDHAHAVAGQHHGHAHHHDHNLKSAYLHVLADALTSVLAIIALLAGKYFGYVWMDPAMGFVGAILVTRWSLGLLRSTSAILLDRQGPEAIRREIREHIESDADSRVADLHLWSIGPNIYAVALTVVAHETVTPAEYKARIPDDLGLAHVTIEVHQCEA
jgi:cation diffusion facilitator family transporter